MLIALAKALGRQGRWAESAEVAAAYTGEFEVRIAASEEGWDLVEGRRR